MKKLIKYILLTSCILFLFSNLVGCESEEERKIKEAKAAKELEQLLNEKKDLEEQSNAIDNIALSCTDVHNSAGSHKVFIKVNNNSDKDIEYMKIVLYEVSKDGKTIQSDWTNTSNVLSGASQSVEAYFDFNQSNSTIKYEIDDIRFKK